VLQPLYNKEEREGDIMQAIDIANAQHTLSILNGGVQVERVLHYLGLLGTVPPSRTLGVALRCLFPKGAANKQEV
jgi:hypothetical protein